MTPIRIQGVLVVIDGVGVLIRGPSGSGKSTAALRLMDRGHHLVSDDLVEVVQGPSGKTIGRAVESDVRIEVRGLGIFNAESLFKSGTVLSSSIDFLIDLDAYDAARDAGRIEPDTSRTDILGKDLLVVRVPVPSGGDAALLIELLARRYKATGTVTAP